MFRIYERSKGEARMPQANCPGKSNGMIWFPQSTKTPWLAIATYQVVMECIDGWTPTANVRVLLVVAIEQVSH